TCPGAEVKVMLSPGPRPSGTAHAMPKHGFIPQARFQVLLAALGGFDGLMKRSTQNGAARPLPTFVTVTLIDTGSPAAKASLLGVSVRSRARAATAGCRELCST